MMSHDSFDERLNWRQAHHITRLFLPSLPVLDFSENEKFRLVIYVSSRRVN